MPTKETMLEAADLAAKAHDLLLTDGWWQGDAMGPDGQRCLAQAIYAETNRIESQMVYDHMPYDLRRIRMERYSMVTSFLWDAIEREIRRLIVNEPNRHRKAALVNWNDCAERTLDEVLDVLRAAEKNIRNEIHE